MHILIKGLSNIQVIAISEPQDIQLLNSKKVQLMDDQTRVAVVPIQYKGFVLFPRNSRPLFQSEVAEIIKVYHAPRLCLAVLGFELTTSFIKVSTLPLKLCSQPFFLWLFFV